MTTDPRDAAIAAVLSIHQPIEHNAFIPGSGDMACASCSQFTGHRAVQHPCRTVRAINKHLEADK